MNDLMTIAQAADLIRAGRRLAVAGPEAALRALPVGAWIGGTIPYFMASEGGVVANEGRVFVTELPVQGQVTFTHYASDAIDRLLPEGPDNGYSLAIVPAFSRAHKLFSQGAADNADAFLKPTVGWVAGVNLADLGRVTPKVFDGRTGAAHEDGMVVAHIALPADQLASIEIVNIFEPDAGDTLRFLETGFEVDECLVNGERCKLSDYLKQHGADDGKLPLVGDFSGAHLNVSVQSVDAKTGRTALYAPVFPGVDYHLAKPVQNYGASFRERLAGFRGEGAAFSCNCILNFVFGGLEGQSIGGAQGPVTFGEIGYQLLNQTMVVLRIQ